MPVTQLILKPTFPLDEDEIARRRRGVKLGHPLTWGAFLTASILPWLVAGNMGSAIFGMIITLGIAAIGVSSFWSGREASVTAQVMEEMISESNVEQNHRLSTIVKNYRSRGLNHYASALGKFLLLKQGIEKRLHPNGRVTQLSEQIERLTDSLCANVCREFDKAGVLEAKLGEILISGNQEALEKLQADQADLFKAIMNAYQTLYETLESLVDFEKSGEVVPDLKTGSAPAETKLEDTVESLKAEIEMARRIKERLKIPDADESDPDFRVFERDTRPATGVGMNENHREME